ncbi:MAG: tetratricopeptide repeat protein, partial [bacterium]
MFSFSAETSAVDPSFARAAAQHLLDGDIHNAVDLCTRGIAAFPQYATGYFVLGKCYESLGRTVESLVEYRRALQLLPDNPEVQSLVRHAEEKEQREFQKFAREQEKKLEGRKETVPVEEFLAKQTPPEESAIEYLAKRLKDVKRMQPNITSGSEPAPLQAGNDPHF